MLDGELDRTRAEMFKAITAFVVKLSILVDMIADKIAHDAEKERPQR